MTLLLALVIVETDMGPLTPFPYVSGIAGGRIVKNVRLEMGQKDLPLESYWALNRNPLREAIPRELSPSHSPRI